MVIIQTMLLCSLQPAGNNMRRERLSPALLGTFTHRNHDTHLQGSLESVMGMGGRGGGPWVLGPVHVNDLGCPDAVRPPGLSCAEASSLKSPRGLPFFNPPPFGAYERDDGRTSRWLYFVRLHYRRSWSASADESAGEQEEQSHLSPFEVEKSPPPQWRGERPLRPR